MIYSLDVDVVELTRKFNTFLLKNKKWSGNVWGDGKVVKSQYIQFVDESGKRTFVCPLCYEEGHKKRDCPEKACDPIRRCFKCNEVGHFKVNCPKGKNKGDTPSWLVSNGSRMVEGSTKKCFRCMEVGHFKAQCPKSEGTMKMRCFKCNSEEHLKAQCPLLKTHVSRDKDKVQKTKFGSRVLLDARENDGLADSELDLARMPKNLRAVLAFSTRGKPKKMYCPSLQPM